MVPVFWTGLALWLLFAIAPLRTLLGLVPRRRRCRGWLDTRLAWWSGGRPYRLSCSEQQSPVPVALVAKHAGQAVQCVFVCPCAAP